MTDLDLELIVALEILVATALGWWGVRVRWLSAEQLEREL